MQIPRSEYPRPQFVRNNWNNLNGEWAFEFDFGNSGAERGMEKPDAPFTKKILVPFCPESALSGIGHKDFMPAVWYRRTVTLTRQELDGRVLLHFGAVDYMATLWVNGKQAGTHAGGYSSFVFDITDFVAEGDNTLTLRAQDDSRSGKQPRGKQSALFHSHGCDYTRTTGIWQTVWMEFVPPTYLVSSRIIPDYQNSSISVTVRTSGCRRALSLKLTASFEGRVCASREVKISGEYSTTELTLSETHLWEPGNPALYDLTYELLQDGKPLDKVTGYFGLRGVEIRGKKFCLNGKSIFQRLVLDQGFYPDGIYTAPSDAALKQDIILSMEAGFNGARLHQKVFEERFLYWADKLGYLVWGEQANWGLDYTTADAIGWFLPEWLEVVERDFNHPAIIGWCPFNETWDMHGCRQDDEVLRMVYLATKATDRTRPVIDTSGNYHVVTDIYDIHDYEQNAEVWKSRYGVPYDRLHETYPSRQKAAGQPFFVSEYGGARWAPDSPEGWGYGDAPKSEEEVGARYEALTTVLLDNPDICAFCYTQLTDVEQEKNGVYHYDRTPKFSKKIYEQIRRANTKKAAIED